MTFWAYTLLLILSWRNCGESFKVTDLQPRSRTSEGKMMHVCHKRAPLFQSQEVAWGLEKMMTEDTEPLWDLQWGSQAGSKRAW